jgi:hypothetical protein
MASEQFVEDRAKSIDICGTAGRRVVTYRLFRCHVARRPHYLLRARDSAPMLDQSGEAKIGKVRFAVCVQQNISRLDVSMQDAVFMCVVNSASDFRDELCRLSGRYRPATGDLVEMISFDEPHAEVVRPLALADFVYRDDPRVI